MDVSENNGSPKSSMLIGFSIINHPFWGTLIFGNTRIVFMMGSSQESESVYGIFWDSVQVVVAHFSSNNPSSTSTVGGETIGSNLEAGMIKQNNPSNYL